MWNEMCYDCWLCKDVVLPYVPNNTPTCRRKSENEIRKFYIKIYKMSCEPVENNFPVGVCCFCGEECNFLSQSCGICVRKVNGYYLGLNKNPFPGLEKPSKEEKDDE